MNKHLLLGSALLAAISAYPQAGKLIKPSGVIESQLKKKEYTESSTHISTPGTGPNKNIKPVVPPINAKVMATATRFTGSMNAFGVIVTESKPLGYNAGVNAVTFVHRKSATYNPNANGNSGTIVSMVSTNAGTTWDSTCVWANANNWARYPQGGIYNPMGNTNINNAYVVAMGPYTSAGGGWTGTANGAWYASKQLNPLTSNTPGSDQQSFAYQGGGLKPHYMSRYSYNAIDGGPVRSIAFICNDPMATTNAAFGLRGALIVKGQFNAGGFLWSSDSLIFPTTMHSGGYKNLLGPPIMAWSEDGQTGYAIMIGSRNTETTSATYVNAKGGYQPIVFKTTTAGASWALLPAHDFADPIKFLGAYDRTYPLNTNTNVTVPFFNRDEGFDATVDFNGQLHIATTMYGHYYNHTDSLGYRYVFGAEQYSWGMSGNFNYPIIYDFYTTPTGGWNYHMVDSMGTEGPSGTSGQPGFNTNVWADGSGGKLDLPSRIQMSRSTDGKQIFYSWTESDSAVIGTKWNIGPNIYTRGFDVTIDKVTPKYAITNTISPITLQGGAFFHYMSPEAILAGANWEIPFTISTNSLYDGGQPMDHYYIKGANIPTNAFTLNPMRPTGVNAISGGIATADVNVYPNPATTAVTLSVNLKESKAFEVAVYNTVGQLIQTIPVNGQIGSNDINMDLSKLSRGVYFCKVRANDTDITKKLVVE